METIVRKTKVIMDNGKEYIFNEYLEDFLKRIYDEEKKQIKSDFIHEGWFSISIDHISCMEDVEYSDYDSQLVKALRGEIII
ncbi:hypothetical protein [Clostridium tetani]|uniref:hypothetical protein n=1 Tax=Clostridium tetani TaxID=1513 RepID=UPI00100BE5A3|nr:hypothetical protein [Clostridium tetani]RXM70841.1 hypothetical protein DP143_13505 [Clostridium tetani]